MRRSAYLVSDLGLILRLPIPRCLPSMARAGRKVGLGSKNRRWGCTRAMGSSGAVSVEWNRRLMIVPGINYFG